MRLNYFLFLVFVFSFYISVFSFGNPVNSKLFPQDTSNTKSSIDFFVIQQIQLIGNKTTKPQIIYRELLFKENDTIAIIDIKNRIEQSRKNILNTSLFNFVTIDTIIQPENRLCIHINLTERWYIWPSLYLKINERNFNTWWETKDLSKLDYGIYFSWENFRGRKESLMFMFKKGYDELYGISYKIPYINKRKTIGLGISGGFSGNHEVPYNTAENHQLFYKEKEQYLVKNIFSTFHVVYRKGIFSTHTFHLSYNDYLFSDTLNHLNPDFSLINHLQYFTFFYLFKRDHRDIKAYPLNGNYFDLEVVKHGFNLLKREKINMAFIHASYRKYWEISKRWYYAGGVNTKISTSAFQPYFLGQGLGYGNDYVRAYEYYVIDGQNFIVGKSNLKFAIIPTKVKKIPFIPFRKFSLLHYSLYTNLLVDVGYAYDRQGSINNKLSNTFLFGTGIGLDFVTYYDKVFRFEYSINKLGENGFFVHFVAPI
ncbi:MAG TPA: hypothetical protein PLC59_06695 [Bacteroidales bacterium]|nr:hypothetical protein [Bacteroidales bacterium]